jgi:hypothetical protein
LLLVMLPIFFIAIVALRLLKKKDSKTTSTPVQKIKNSV